MARTNVTFAQRSRILSLRPRGIAASTFSLSALQGLQIDDADGFDLKERNFYRPLSAARFLTHSPSSWFANRSAWKKRATEKDGTPALPRRGQRRCGVTETPVTPTPTTFLWRGAGRQLRTEKSWRRGKLRFTEKWGVKNRGGRRSCSGASLFFHDTRAE